MVSISIAIITGRVFRVERFLKASGSRRGLGGV